jgi:pimeloyl-ACP methyl ester carboxylesterase
MFRRLAAGLLLTCAAGCAPPPSLLRQPDTTRAGAFGDDGPFGALLLQRSLRVRGDRIVDVDIIAATTDGESAQKEAVPVLLVQGGSVPVERYHWLAAHLASRGAVVVAPHFLADLAFFDQGDAADALAATRARSDDDDDDLSGVLAPIPALAVGHSLGGVVAAGAFETDRDIGALALLASYPDPGSTPTRDDGRVLVVGGERDGLIGVDELVDSNQSLVAPVVAAEVLGLTHFQLTDNPTADNLAREGTTGEDLALVRRRALFLVDALLADVAGSTDDVLADSTRWPEGVLPLEIP